MMISFNKNKFRRALTISLIIIGSLAIYGCQANTSKGPSDINHQPLDRRIGILKSLGGVKTQNLGTHLLQLDDGDTILLHSLQINLEDAKYLNNIVEVRGILTYTTDGTQIMEVMNIDVLNQEARQQQVSASWKDYLNEKYGFSIKYRDDLNVSETNNIIIFAHSFMPELPSGLAETQQTQGLQPVVHELMISKTQLKKGQDLMSWYKENHVDLTAASDIVKSKIGADGLDAIKESFSGGVAYHALVGNTVFNIQLNTLNDEQSLKDQNLFYEMLTTFRALNQNETGKAEADVLNNLLTEEKQATSDSNAGPQ